VAADIVAEGHTALGVPTDVSSKADIWNMVAATVEAFGTVDILVNNAQGFGTADKPRASTIPTPMEDTDDAEGEHTFRTGATATLWGMQAVFPYMKVHGGRIVNFSSGSGMEGFPGNTPCNTTKEAIRALTRTAAREWGKYGISVNTVNPSLRTDAWENWEANNSEFVQRVEGQDAARLPGRSRAARSTVDRVVGRQGRRVRHRHDDHAPRRPPHALAARAPLGRFVVYE